MISLSEANEELRSIGIWSSISHGQSTSTTMAMIEILISESITIDRLAARPIVVCKVTSLCHETRNDSVEDRLFEVHWSSMTANAFFSSTENSKILRCLGSISK